MFIELSLGIGREYERIEVEKGTAVEALYKANIAAVDHDIFACKVNNEIRSLTYCMEEECKVQLLDIRVKQAFLIYQHSLVLLFMKALSDVVGFVRVDLQASLNEGLFLQSRNRELTDDEVAKTFRRMKEIAAADRPITVRDFSGRAGRKLLRESGLERTSSIIERLREDEQVKIYTLDGYSDFFYDYLVPSTGYLKDFELMKYRDGLLVRFPQPEAPDTVPGYVDEYMVYNALHEQRKWNNLLGVRFLEDLNAKIESEEYKQMIKLSEALHNKKVVEIADAITAQKKRIILILGPSSSGKTTFARRLCIQLMVNGLHPLYVGTDDYFVEREDTPVDEKGEHNFEGIDALDLPLFNAQMKALLAGEEVDLPVFDFLTGHKVFGRRVTKLEEGAPIVIEGIHAFNPLLTGQIEEEEKYKIYISPLTHINLDAHNRIPTTDTRLIRRMVRDNSKRGYDAAKTLKEWRKVHDAENTNIFPYTSEADVFFNSVHLYEMAVFKKHVEPLLREIGREDPEYPEAQRLLRLFSFVESIEDESSIGNDSILREFIGGSVFE